MLHIKIVDEKTNEVLVDEKTNCIIGAIGHGEDGEHGMSFLHGCNAIETVAAIQAAKDTMKKVVEDKPELKLLLKMIEVVEGE